MIEHIRDFLGTISGYKQLYEQERGGRIACLQSKGEIQLALADAKEVIRQLELLVPRPIPPKIDYIVEKDALFIRQCLEGLSADIKWLQLDNKYYLTDEPNFRSILAWDNVNTWEWRKNIFDCENHSIGLKSHIDEIFHLNNVGIVIDYLAGHAYNIVVFPNGTVRLIEPQNDNLFEWVKGNNIYILKDSFVLL